MEQLAKNIAYLISQSTKTGGEIARELTKNQSTLSNWSGGYAKPGLDDFVALARYFNVSADDLLFTDLSTQEHKPKPQYNNDAHLELLIESYEIRIKQAEDLNKELTLSNETLKTLFDNLQSALKANYVKPKKDNSTIKR